MKDNGKLHDDDPRLTAYALGELDPDEAAEIESAVAQSPELQRLVDEVRQTARLVEEGIAAEASSLSPARRARVESEIEPRGFGLRWVAAAALLVVAGMAVVWSVSKEGAEGNATAPRSESVAATDAPQEVRTDLRPANLGSRTADELSQETPDFAPRRRSRGVLRNEMPQLPSLSGNAATGREEPAPVFEANESSVLQELPYLGGVLIEPDVDPPATQMSEVAEQLAALGYIKGEAEEPEPEPRVRAVHNPWQAATREPLSTFSIDVDTASYSNARRHLEAGAFPPPDSVRIEEFVNYFTYDDPAPSDGAPFRVTTEVASCPWQPDHRLVRIGLKARSIDWGEREASNLVLLIDASGSMSDANKLPLLKRAIRMLVNQLDERDRLTVVAYAQRARVVVPPTACHRRAEILDAVDRLEAHGSTNGSAGIDLAYRLAQESFIRDGVNRVILATDGDFNVGVTEDDALVRLIEEKRRGGVFLSIFGFGTRNTKEAKMEQLADHGNGSFAYIDSLAEAYKALVSEVGGTMVPVAVDVKVQVELNPAVVQGWRLLGYENRLLAHRDFDVDAVDAGEMGAGHSVVALYEVIPHGVSFDGGAAAPLRYGQDRPASDGGPAGEVMFVKVRYKEAAGAASKLVTMPVQDHGLPWAKASTDFRFAAAAAGFAMLLRKSPGLGGFGFEDVERLILASIGLDRGGYRAQFLSLAGMARLLEK